MRRPHLNKRKQREEVLRESHQLLVESQDIAKIGSYILDGNSMEWTSSKALDAIFGISENYERNVTGWLKVIHPDDRQMMEDYLSKEVFGQARDFFKTYRIVRVCDGEECWVEGRGRLELDENGQILRMLGTIQDITERKLAEDDLRESEANFKALATQSTEGISVADMAGNYTYVNPTFCDMVGWTSEELLQMTVFDVTADKQDKATFAKTITVEEGSPVNVVLVRKNGSEFIAEVVGKVLSTVDEGRVLGTIRDITERIQAEKALLESEENFRALATQSMEGITVVDRAGNYTYANPAFCDMTGWTEEELLKMAVFDLAVKNADNPTFEKTVTDNETNPAIVKLARKDGTKFRAEVTAKVLSTSGEGQILGSIRDITKRLEAVEELRQARDFSENLIDTADAIIVTLDCDARITSFNRFAEKLTGRSKGEVLGKNWFELFIPERDVDTIPSVFSDALAEMPDVSSYENPIRVQPHGERLISWRNSILRDSEGNTIGMLSMGTDITDKAKLENQLIQAQKMEAVGRLAGGVAHDFNNMLGVILGNIEMAMDHVNPSEPIHADLTEVRKAAERSTDLTRQLLAFARKQAIAPKHLDLNDAVENILNMLRRLLGEDIDLVWLPGKINSMVKLDPSQIDQILANLCINARDAIDDVGKITIETEMTTLDRAYCADNPGAIPGDYVMLAVSDDGSGFDKEVLGKLYEPFFTTKEVGKGTGLGLSTVYGIVKQNGGYIFAYSEPGHGSSFKIYLPIHGDRSESQVQEKQASIASAGQETILLVEDEPSILKLTKRILEGQGYNVLASSTPEEALHLGKENSDKIHLLFTDVIMPGMNGRDLLRELETCCPNLKSLFMSGYTADVIADHGVLDEGIQFIQKPFSKDPV
jgi:two-component system, cell cycle sensor histidine kinase and response regulator CckA